MAEEYERKISNIEKVSIFPNKGFEYWFRCSYCNNILFVTPSYSIHLDERVQFVMFCRACANAFIPIPELREMSPEIVSEIHGMIDNFKLMQLQDEFIKMIQKMFDANPDFVAKTIGEDLKKAKKIQNELKK